MGANIVKLKDVVDILNGYAFKSLKYVKSGHRVMRITNVQKGILVDDAPKYYEQSNDLNKYELKIGDILISLTGNVGRVGMVEEQILPAYLNQRVGCLRIKSDKVFDRYLFHLLNNDSFEDNCIRNSNGIAQLNMSTEWLKDVDINLPSLDEQKKIAKILDKADEIRTKKKQANEKLDEFLKTTFIDMFGDPVKNEKHFPLVKFSDMGTLARGKSKHRPRNAPELLGGQYPLIQTGDIANAGLYLRKYNQTYSELGLKQSKMWRMGTLCITIAANIAKTSIMTFDACFPDSIVGFNNNEKSNIQYIQFWLMFLQAVLEAEAPQSAQKNINLEILNGLSLPYPPIEEQNKFAQIVEKVEEQKQRNEKIIEQMDNLFNSLSQRAFKGELLSSEPPNNVIDLQAKQVLLHTKIIDKCRTHQTFGSVKLEKLFNICDMTQDLNLMPSGYHRMAAGPYSPKMRYSVEDKLQKNKWIKITKTHNKIEYKKDANFVAYKAVYNQIFNDKNQEIEKIIDYFYDKDTNYCEAFSTLYMCWNDLILEGKNPTKTEIIDEFKNHWAPEKQRFERIYLLKILSDMSNQGFEPQGHGVHTIESNYNHNKDQLSLQLK